MYGYGGSSTRTPSTGWRWSKLPHRCLQLSFGIDEEIGGCDYALTNPDSLEHDKVVADVRSGFDLAWLKVTVTVIHKCNLPRARLQDARSGNNNLLPERHAQVHIDVHAGFE